jgi:hypothetical protein
MGKILSRTLQESANFLQNPQVNAKNTGIQAAGVWHAGCC